MGLFITLVSLMLLSTAASSADVYRDGETLALKGAGYCFAMGLDNLKSNIPDKTWTPLRPILMAGISSKRDLTAKEFAICFGDAPQKPAWVVAPSSTGDRPVYSWGRRASGKVVKTKTSQRIQSGMPCASDPENTYPITSTKSRMWRSLPADPALVSYCAKNK